jgi:hypothetical protein
MVFGFISHELQSVISSAMTSCLAIKGHCLVMSSRRARMGDVELDDRQNLMSKLEVLPWSC